MTMHLKKISSESLQDICDLYNTELCDWIETHVFLLQKLNTKFLNSEVLQYNKVHLDLRYLNTISKKASIEINSEHVKRFKNPNGDQTKVYLYNLIIVSVLADRAIQSELYRDYFGDSIEERTEVGAYMTALVSLELLRYFNGVNFDTYDEELMARFAVSFIPFVQYLLTLEHSRQLVLLKKTRDVAANMLWTIIRLFDKELIQ